MAGNKSLKSDQNEVFFQSREGQSILERGKGSELGEPSQRLILYIWELSEPPLQSARVRLRVIFMPRGLMTLFSQIQSSVWCGQVSLAASA